jgi:hypothetical protein
MARPTKLTAEVRERIARAVRLGASYEHAAMAGGVSYRTLRNWMARGEAESRGPFLQLLHATKRPRLRARSRCSRSSSRRRGRVPGRPRRGSSSGATRRATGAGATR